MTTPQPLIYDLNLPQLEDWVKKMGQPTYRAKQIWEGLYQHLWNQPEQFTPLSKDLRQQLKNVFSFSHLAESIVQISSDGETRKTLFALPNSQSIEAVLMMYRKRRTLCISTQAGCAMGCVFCATGQMGFRNNLSSGEIIEQVLYYARQLAALGERVTNIVVMGMGEPFHNYQATLTAIDQLNHPLGFKLGARRFTISTVGLVPMIQRFTKENRQTNLAISLHAADNKLRSSMMPINKKYPLEDLLQACREYVKVTHRRITFEWALIMDVNDSEEHARRLAERLRGILCHVNIIPLNATQGYNGKATTRDRAIAFRDELERYHIPCTIRIRRGIDIQAGCGQLATHSQSKKDSP